MNKKKKISLSLTVALMLFIGTSDRISEIILPRYYFYRAWTAGDETDLFGFQERLLNLALSGNERALDSILRVSDRPGLDGSFAEICEAFAGNCLCLVGDERFSAALERADQETQKHLSEHLSVSDLPASAPRTLKTLHLNKAEIAYKAKYGLPLSHYRNIRDIISR